MPVVADEWRVRNVRMTRVLGINGVEDDNPYLIYARLHFVTASFAVLSTQIFGKASKIYD